jgi:AcrR family transcriptional regulator
MPKHSSAAALPASRPGRPRRGTETERADALICAATRVFLREGYGLASIDKVASEAGASTRTIYERFKNKADLLAAVISRLVDRDLASIFSSEELDPLAPREALTVIGRTLVERITAPDPAALYRIIASEAHRFPELVERMRSCASLRVENSVAAYLRNQTARGSLALSNADAAAALFLHMLTGELRKHMLFGDAAAIAGFDFAAHVGRVVDLFLDGALPRTKRHVRMTKPS